MRPNRVRRGFEPVARAAVSCAPAISSPMRSRSISPAGYAAESSPREITAMRSAISKISSRSWLMTRTAAPPRAMSTSTCRMSAAAPASTPQVGWLITRTAGSRSSSRPTTNFWRFPPESEPAGGSSRLVRTSNRSMTRPATARVAGRSMNPTRTRSPSDAWRVSSTLSESAKPGTALWPIRSSGTNAAPSRRRAVTPRVPQRSPAIAIAPGIGASRSPDSASKSSDCPLPATPAIATTSPARTSSETPRSATAKGPSAGSDSAWTSSLGGPSGACASALTACTSAPTISRASEAAVSTWGSTFATTLPRRRMVAS